MRKKISITISTIIVIFFGFSCTDYSKKYQRASSIGDTDTTITSNNNPTINKAICNMSWGITEDSFTRLSEEWINTNKNKDGFSYYGGMKIKNDGLTAEYDKDHHLNKVTMEFVPFRITPQKDYTEEEKQMIRQSLIEHNRKEARLINAISESYGKPSRNSFSEDNTDIYLQNCTTTIAEWSTKETHATLKSVNNGSINNMEVDTKLILITEGTNK